mgnify:FL=1
MNLFNDFQVSVYVASISSFLISVILCFLLIKYISNVAKSKNTQKRLNDFNILPLGGVAMAISFFISVRLLGEADPEIVNISIFALAISLLGVLDDFFNLNWKLKLFFQLIFVSLPIYILDQKINLEIFLGIDFGGLVNFVFTIFWVITLMNSINFIDNMDGFAAINCSFICLAITVLSFVFNQNYLADISFVLFASIFGFILFNYPPAKIFMGDSGSLFIGFVFGFISILFNWNPTSDIQLYNSIAPVFLFFTIPILDFLTVFYHRIKNNISPTTGGTDHISHRLLKKGLSVRRILYLFIGLNIIVFLIIAATIIFETFANLAFFSYILIISYLFFYFQKLEPLN